MEDDLTVERDTDKNLGFGYDNDDGGYVTGNEANVPDHLEALLQTPDIPDEIPEIVEEYDGEPGAGDSRLGLGGATGTERFDSSPPESIPSPNDPRALGGHD